MMMRTPIRLASAAALAIAATPAFAVDDGPRAYFPLPAGTTNINVIGLFQNGNASLDPVTAVRNARLDVDVAALQLTRTFDLGGHAVALAAVLPYGEVRGRATLVGPAGNVLLERQTRSSGFGDASVAAIVGLIGSPALRGMDYARHQPGFSLGAMLWVTAPTGEYDSARLVNLGTNRWSVRFGAPMGWALGGSYLSPRLTTIEFVPSLTLYTANDAPFRARRLQQAPLFRVEGHLTHNFNRALWVSADITANSGAGTSTDGRDDNNHKRWAGAGVTAGFNLSRRFGLSASYGGIIARNASAPDGDGVRINLRGTF